MRATMLQSSKDDAYIQALDEYIYYLPPFTERG